MRILSILFFFFFTFRTAIAEDRIIVRQDSLSPPITPPGQQRKTASSLGITIAGTDFKQLEKRVQDVVALIGNKTEWQDLGPDAAYVSLEIHYRNKKYLLRSWYPLYREITSVAVSETRGLVSVTGIKEKARIEEANSKRYKTITGLYDLIQKISRQNSGGGTR